MLIYKFTVPVFHFIHRFPNNLYLYKYIVINKQHTICWCKLKFTGKCFFPNIYMTLSVREMQRLIVHLFIKNCSLAPETLHSVGL